MAGPRGGRGGDRRRGGHGGAHSNRGRGKSHAQNDERSSQGVSTPRNQGRQNGGSSNARGSPSSSTVTTAIDSPAPNFAPHEYQKRLQFIKAQRPKIRAKFIKDGLMNPDGQMRLADSVKLYGLCQEMCPEYERVRRIVELDVKAPECTPETQHLPSRNQRKADESRMVKAYARSAAGMDVELVSEIRNPATCLRTLKYLYGRLDEDDFEFLHSWLWDRTRAVRKDLRTQRIENRHDINILLTSLEYSARFYMLSAHHMARSNKDNYSHQQDVEQLNQTLISLKERYVDNRRAGIISTNEAEFWAYRLILAPIYANTALENELHHLPSDLKHNPRIQTALEIFRLLKSIIIHRPTKNSIQCQSNWKKFWDLIRSPRVSYLMACAAAISFNRVRHVVLDAVWRVYRLGLYRHQRDVTDWTTGKLREVLGMDTDSEAVKFCEAHGFVFGVDENGATYMDIKQRFYERKAHVLPKADVKPQFFSASIVEPKRYGRPLSAVIAGQTVREATTGAMPSKIPDHGTSLFIPEAPKGFSQQPNGANSSASGLGLGFTQNTSPFQFNGSPTVSTNPFDKRIQPGVFDASKNSIIFAPSTNTNANPFAPFQSASEEPVANPFQRNNNVQPQSTPIVPSAEQNKRNAAEKQRLEDEARQRVQAAQRARQAKEAEQRREAEAAAARQLQEQADRERKARERQEELARQARQRQVQEEQATTARIQEMDAALFAITEDIMFNPREGLLLQWIDNAADTMAQDVAKALEMERRVAKVDQNYEAYLKDLKRAALAKIMMAVQKKKKMERARERRKRWKQTRARALTRNDEVVDMPAPVKSTLTNSKAPATSQPDGHSTPQQSVAAPNSRCAKRTEQRHKAQVSETNGVKEKVPTLGNSRLGAAKMTSKASNDASTSINKASDFGYSQAYLKAAQYAPVDRTETDWFRLRAQGIDPSKYRKRSFDFTSSDDDKPKLIEPKRAKLATSPPATEDPVPTPPKTMEEEQRARIEALRHSFRTSRSGTSPSSSFNGAISAYGRSSFGDSTSLLERARRTIAETKAGLHGGMSLYRSGPFDGHASPVISRANDVVHDFSRSVPNLGFSASQSHASTFGNSIGPTASTKNRPAYWDRPSRFVPKHLFGKGGEAVLAWRKEQGLSKSPASTRPASTEPLAISSPITTFEAYAQPQPSQMGGYLSSPTNTFDTYSMQPIQATSYTPDQYTNDASDVSGVEVVDVDAEDSHPITVGNEVSQYSQDVNLDFYTNSHYASQEHHKTYTQDAAEDADSEMLDEDDVVDYTNNMEDDAGSDDDDEELDDSVQESYDEEDDEEEEEEDVSDEEDEDVSNANTNGMQPGATEDDAIELSD
ncbi:hypothetical protein PTRG_01052 [Pyrenophora tritici-repentis Pt-1C-BFP]|uniref:SAC3/GANP/THP3 conserved domain-containing protein n=1 Tax=Pyrenophora tritici-repentis (strain Pt-1C-BFP) TaxID=426418 RepID=B2VUJ6_PYRTR|nr:uncharacterized protein PTRG_01052 [Pyrenophora tritici-repentis Pt-1C-BFP]EDU40490.1 hypothetical protein PTRG_01052 [Pyrenophora tritici-repentis Pt-1C-BFP]